MIGRAVVASCAETPNLRLFLIAVSLGRTPWPV